jgi:predicted membrane channel-forming protein YqfA (hemolysin III family)
LASLTLWAKKEFLTLIPLFLAGAASSLSAMIIYDSTRSGTFAFIGIFFALAICKKYLTERQLRLILMGIALLCFLHPLANKTHGMGFFLM